MTTNLRNVSCGFLVFAVAAIASYASCSAQQTRVVPPEELGQISLWGSKMRFVDLSTQSNQPTVQVVPNPGGGNRYRHRGLKVTEVYDGPAMDAGLEYGDIIVKIGNYKIYDNSSLRQALSNNRRRRVRTTVINVRDGEYTYVDVWNSGRGDGFGGGRGDDDNNPPPMQSSLYDVSISATSFTGFKNTEIGDEEYWISYSVSSQGNTLFSESKTFEHSQPGRRTA